MPSLIGTVLEPILFLLGDRYPRRWFVCIGLLAMSAGSFVAALAPNLAVVSVAETIAGIAAGCAVTLAQATLVDAHPEARERVMARWVLFALAGDLVAPLLFGALAAAGLGWRAAFAMSGVLVAFSSLALLAARFPAARVEEAADDEPGLFAGLRIALENRRLLLWLAGCALCDLLDEILVVLATLHIRDAGLGSAAQSASLAAFVVGGAVGVAALERLLSRIAPLRLLAASAIACAALYLTWVAVASASGSWPSIALFALVGATAAPLYPLAKAEAYAALPGRSGAVNAASVLLDPFTLALPWLLGWVADAHGTAAALALLAVQPIGLALIAGLSISSRSGRPR